MRRLLRLVRLIFGFPVRLYRRRLAVQLVFSHTLVVLLTALILQLTLVGAFSVAYVKGAIPGTTAPDFTLREPVEWLALTVGPDVLDAAEAGDAARLSTLEHRMRAVVGVEEPGQTDSLDAEPNELEHIVVINAEGRIVATSDAAWAPHGAAVEELGEPLVVRLGGRALELAGEPSGHGNLWLVDGEDQTTVTTYPIMSADGVFRGVVLLHHERLSMAGVFPPLPAVAVGVIASTVIWLSAVGIPALLVAIPIGIIRARRVSKRISTLAEAADAMAQGDLSRRVDIDGHDEVARLGIRFNEMIESVDRTDQARKRFIANVSHDLRTPVAIIRGHIEHRLAQGEHARQNGSGAGVAESDVSSLEIMHQEVLTLERLIDDLFTLARLEEATLKIEPSPQAIDEVARNAVESVRPVAWAQRKITVESLVPADLPPVLADRTRLQQIFGNLLYNALRYTPEGGLVVVGAEARDQVVEVSVSDTGVGIPAEELERVFERHHRATNSGGMSEATGLGLAIVKQLVEAQGGTITAESRVGEGSVFRFTLPVANPQRTKAGAVLAR